ncbi:MAG: hypothetical protein ACE5HV_00070 [Acidobacteriota bacterium]
MSKLRRLTEELQSLEAQGLIAIEDGVMTILSHEEEVKGRILQTGPWGALLLMGKLDEAIKEIKPPEFLSELGGAIYGNPKED